MNTHTPGPWRVTRHGNRMIKVESKDRVIFDGFNGEDANAQLAAAAPELLAALQIMLGCELMGGDQREGLGPDKPGTSPVAKARAAIAKATGQTP